MGLGSKTGPLLVDRTGSRGSHAVLGLRGGGVSMGSSGSASIYLRVEWAQAPVPAPGTLGWGWLGAVAVRSFIGPQPRCEDCWQGEKISEGPRRGVLGGFRDPAGAGRRGVGPRRKVISKPAGGARA